jgi:predicted alpha/beta-hydrolase family hydrolase
VDAAETPTAVLWLGHGAGGGIEARDLTALAAALPARGITVARYEQPWRVAGRRVAAAPATLDIAWRETAPVVAELAAGLPVVVGGRSAGARVACRTAQAVGASAVVCLAFPLHPPGRPERSRLAELLLPEVPVLALQGDRDAFGTAADLARLVAGVPSIRVMEVAGADHGMRTPKAATGVDGLLVSSVAAFVSEVPARVTPRSG